ncbi:target of rapamycin complex 2 subunit MAPKAP1 [Strongylocentrotus purpuratus]|uniref:Target of rapamycin complex 2 subunit MAPKAP1 n=1 Tax=Strongylocentrotus purpuratus TaxID=7668 RepID=A0A7M7REV4_STRPU|nr:target of rapamycin complex 2 subunit MAPKAP1 [Strongylocentrotus purpuratus]|eukprot:XP_011663809.1 PREDICTED: target of rapamycin complex 2 subunit MAPKAP1 [Strongylocentrotus purpuratus]
MALLDDPAFIIAHIRHSFITSDDTGMCEMAIMNEELDWPQKKKEMEEKRKSNKAQFDSFDNDQGYDDVEIYGESYEIESSFDYSFRHRSNTAVRLDKLRHDRMTQTQCQRIKWKEEASDFPEEELEDLFGKKEVKEKPKILKSSLSIQLERFPDQATNIFAEYANFDGKGHAGGGGVKRIEIFLTMVEPTIPDRRFLKVVVTNNAKVQDLIGLICWHYVNKGLQPELKENLESYCLMISEEDGEVDTDFPALDSREAISKFGFNTLALVEKDAPEDDGKPGSKDNIIVTIKSSDGESRLAVDSTQITLRQILTKALRKRKGIIPTAGPHYLLEKKSAPGVPLDLDLKLCETESMDFIMVREHSRRDYLKSDRTRPYSGDREPPLVLSTQYRSFRVSMLHKLRPATEIQLGISGDKIEIDPVAQPRNTPAKFWGKQKAVSIESDRLAFCNITDDKPSGKSTFRLTFKSPNHEFKHYDFETGTNLTKQIVNRINHILELRASSVRNDYTLWRERRHSRKAHDK